MSKEGNQQSMGQNVSALMQYFRLPSATASAASAFDTIALLSVALLVFAHAVASVSLPFGWDHGMMAAVGDTYLRGELPYRDSWEVKGPLAYMPFSLATLLFGKAMWGIRVLDLLLLIPALWYLYRFLEARTTSYLAVAGSLFLYLWLRAGGWFFTAQPEAWVAELSIIAICPLLLSANSGNIGKKAPISGALIGLAALIKPFYIGLAAVPLIIFWLSPRQRSEKTLLSFYLVLNAAVPVVVTIAYFAAMGGLPKLIEVQLKFTALAYSASFPRSFFDGLWEFIMTGPAGVVLALAIAGLIVVRRETALFVPICAWFCLTLFFVTIQRKYYLYHWFPFYPPLVVLAGFAFNRLLKSSVGSLQIRAAAYGIAAVSLLLTVERPMKEIWKFAIYDSDRYYQSFYRWEYNALDQLNAANYLRKHTEPDDRVFIYGLDATVRYLADRKDPTRFTYDLPLIVDTPMRAPYRAEAMDGLKKAPPAYIVYGKPWTGKKPDTLVGFPELQRFVADGYTLEKSFGIVDLYRRNGTPSG